MKTICRRFLSALARLAAAASGPPPAAPVHVYDWRGGYTTDPARCPLRYGAAAPRVYLNGVDVSDTKITRAVTGPAGLVERLVTDAAGRIQPDDPPFQENAKTEILRGHVAVR